MTTDIPVRVMVVDDSAVVRGLITRMLTSDARLEMVASCSNGEMAVIQAPQNSPTSSSWICRRGVR